jgi:Zn-dependent protease with chaperone function
MRPTSTGGRRFVGLAVADGTPGHWTSEFTGALSPATRDARCERRLAPRQIQRSSNEHHVLRFATHACTWLLIAGLTALLVGIGALIGGAFLYLFAGLAVAFNVIGDWFSDRIALTFSRARPVEPGTMPQLEALIQDLARRARVPAPRLSTIPSEQPNAFATGRNPQRAAVAVTEGLLHDLPSVQIKGVLAHEFAHIKYRDILVIASILGR